MRYVSAWYATVKNTPFPPPSRHLSAVAETNELGRDAAVFT